MKYYTARCGNSSGLKQLNEKIAEKSMDKKSKDELSDFVKKLEEMQFSGKIMDAAEAKNLCSQARKVIRHLSLIALEKYIKGGEDVDKLIRRTLQMVDTGNDKQQGIENYKVILKIYNMMDDTAKKKYYAKVRSLADRINKRNNETKK